MSCLAGRLAEPARRRAVAFRFHGFASREAYLLAISFSYDLIAAMVFSSLCVVSEKMHNSRASIVCPSALRQAIFLDLFDEDEGEVVYGALEFGGFVEEKT